MAEGIGNANDWGDLQEQQTEIEALQGNLTPCGQTSFPPMHK